MSRALLARLRLPVVAAPMFLVSGPEMVIAAAHAGIVGAFPTPNCRTALELDDWMTRIVAGTDGARGMWAANLVTHSSNTRLADGLTNRMVPLGRVTMMTSDECCTSERNRASFWRTAWSARSRTFSRTARSWRITTSAVTSIAPEASPLTGSVHGRITAWISNPYVVATAR